MLEFELDFGNLRKLRIVKIIRKIDLDEVLSVFEDDRLDVYPAKDNPVSPEKRFMAIGMSGRKRDISVIFTMRENKIRPFNAWQTKGNKKSSFAERQPSCGLPSASCNFPGNWRAIASRTTSQAIAKHVLRAISNSASLRFCRKPVMRFLKLYFIRCVSYL